MAPTGTFHGRGGAKLDPFKFLDPKMPVRRFERAVPGDLLHLDIKKLAKFDQPGHGVTGDCKVNRERRRLGKGVCPYRRSHSTGIRQGAAERPR